MITRQEFSLAKIRFMILDEADKMLEMGFQEPIEEIFEHVYKQTEKV